MSPRRLTDLELRERRRVIARLVLSVTAIVAILFAAYYALPPARLVAGAPLLRLLVSCLVFILVLAWLVRRIVRADLPELRAIEVLAIIVPLFLCLFANLYLAMSHASAAAFSEPLNHTGALYFAITIFSTVGFGDITPRHDLARRRRCADAARPRAHRCGSPAARHGGALRAVSRAGLARTLPSPGVYRQHEGATSGRATAIRWRCALETSERPLATRGILWANAILECLEALRFVAAFRCRTPRKPAQIGNKRSPGALAVTARSGSNCNF